MRERVGSRRNFLKDEHIPAVFFEPDGVGLDVSQNSVEVVLVDAQKVAVVLAQDDRGRARCIVDERQLSKIVALLQGGDHPLAVNYNVHRPLENDVPRVAFIALVEHWKLATHRRHTLIPSISFLTQISFEWDPKVTSKALIISCKVVLVWIIRAIIILRNNGINCLCVICLKFQLLKSISGFK